MWSCKIIFLSQKRGQLCIGIVCVLQWGRHLHLPDAVGGISSPPHRHLPQICQWQKVSHLFQPSSDKNDSLSTFQPCAMWKNRPLVPS